MRYRIFAASTAALGICLALASCGGSDDATCRCTSHHVTRIRRRIRFVRRTSRRRITRLFRSVHPNSGIIRHSRVGGYFLDVIQ